MMNIIIKKFVLLSMAVLLCSTSFATTYSIESTKVNNTKIYFGKSDNFEKPAELSFTKILKETSEFKYIKKYKLDKTSGKYWILFSKASDKVISIINDISKKNEFDIITEKGYLYSVDKNIKNINDLTDLAILKLKNMEKSL